MQAEDEDAFDELLGIGDQLGLCVLSNRLRSKDGKVQYTLE